jgi:hypothetical protein
MPLFQVNPHMEQDSKLQIIFSLRKVYMSEITMTKTQQKDKEEKF